MLLTRQQSYPGFPADLTVRLQLLDALIVFDGVLRSRAVVPVRSLPAAGIPPAAGIAFGDQQGLGAFNGGAGITPFEKRKSYFARV